MRLDRRLWGAACAMIVLSACTKNAGTRVDNVGEADPNYVQAVAATVQQRQANTLQMQFSALPAAEQNAVRAAAQSFATLSTDKQQVMRAEFEALDDVTRRGYLLGPTLGRAWPHLQPAFGYVPESERAAVLAMLRGLDREHLSSLERVAWRTPVDQREALRAKLLSMSATERNTWLFEQSF